MEGSSKPIPRSRTRTQAAANRIRQQILCGAWANGRLLPSERDMAAQFGVARNTLRRIIRQLEAEGLLECQPGRGSVVRLLPLGDQMSRAEPAPAVAAASQPDVLEMCRLLEPLVAEMAAARATVEDLHDLNAALRNASAAGDADAFAYWDFALRHALWRATHNAALLAWFEAVKPALPPCAVAAEERGERLRERAAIVAAVRDRNPKLAGALMRTSMMMPERTPRRPRVPAEV